MSRRLAAIACALLFVLAAILGVVTSDPWPSYDGLSLGVLAVTAAVGLVILRHQTGNAVGWLFVATALVGSLDPVAREYLVLDYRQHGGSLPLGPVAVEWRGGVTLLVFLIAFPAILLFPDGTVPSRRWRRMLRVYVLAATVFTVAQFVDQTTSLEGLKVDIRGGLPNASTGHVAGWLWILTPFFVAFWLASVGHQARRWRGASDERRAQLKWLMSGAATAVVSSIVLVVTSEHVSLVSRLVADAALIGIAALPISIGVGILKYRLYEIDRLISRTLSYLLVTGLLVGMFVGLVVLTTRVLPFSSPVGVAASTLAAAALFNPLRLRTQRLVDRRFNRARYDAEATVTAFRLRLREAVDLDTVQRELLHAADRAVEPTHTSLWIVPPGKGSRR